MAESKAEATKFECDAPKCDVVHVVVGDDKPKGRRLTSEGPDGKPVRVYACKATHIRPAVEAAEERAALERVDADADQQPADTEPERNEDDDSDDLKALEELEAVRPVAV